ncbi:MULTISPECIES: NAD(P)H-dependent oxidoreductase [Streptomyces]|uniref:Putative flavoprotein n=1 Tax=Streptomyces chartreusis NRRL 3882 TaxID=1079985 RepID=A0A2N9BDB4_STRCX|nr:MULTISPECIES: NAD(P)H-dependent oxidoreductase [Streptomyces]MYS89764.1 flavodoxin family protein [Streptomyces sp. SID5464]SOR81358.1 putative flavoprotein [Streptomyces chartreusis NRRL 3882]
MRLLGLACGQEDGSAEVLLKAALTAAAREGTAVEMVRLTDLSLVTAATADAGDDAAWFCDRLLDADGVIVSSPTYTRSAPGALKLLIDRAFGPRTDVVFVREALARREHGPAEQKETRGLLGVDTAPDPRVLKPRVAGFIAVGGCPSPHWRTLTLPTLHALAFPLHMAVADQMEVPTPGGLGGTATDPAAVLRAERLGGAVARQLGLPHDEVRFLGEPGTCPMCHLDLIVLRGGRAECGTCGAAGRFVVQDGDVRVDFSPAGAASSVHTLTELEEHYRELLSAASLEPDPQEIDKHAAAFRDSVPVLRPPRP